jgi:dolichol-phosphate mannosyltransferase
MIQIDKRKQFISIIVYLINDKKIFNTLININEYLKNNFENFEFIFISDNLDFSFTEEFKDFIKKNISSSVNLITFSFFQGIEKAMNSGVELSIGDFIIELDNIFGLTDVSFLEILFDYSQKNFDLVLLREKRIKFSSLFFYKVFNSFSKSPNSIGSDFVRLISRRAINRIQSLSKSIPYRKALYASSGLKTKVLFSKGTNKALSTLSFNRSETASTAIIIFTNFAYRFSFLFTMVFMGLTLLSSIYTTYIFFQGKPIEGYTTVMLLISGSFFGLFLVLLIIIKYLSVLIQLVFSKENHIIESIEKIK